MKTAVIFRVLVLPLGLIFKLWSLALEGSRDINNKFRFRYTKIGGGCCINQNSQIAPNTNILSKCIINNSKIEQYTYLGNNCIVQNTNIGKFCSIANDVLIGLGKHPINQFSTSPLFYRVNNPLNIKLVDSNSEFQEYQQIKIGNDVWIGARSIILDGVTIGHGAIIAANSVVTKDIQPYSIVGGTPAKIIKYRFSTEEIENLLQSEWWNKDLTEIKKYMKTF